LNARLAVHTASAASASRSPSLDRVEPRDVLHPAGRQVELHERGRQERQREHDELHDPDERLLLARDERDRIGERGQRAGDEHGGHDEEEVVEMTPEARERAMQIYRPIGEPAIAAFGRFTVAELETVERFLETAAEVRWLAVGIARGDVANAPTGGLKLKLDLRR
jgi:hypothetical protein